MLGFVVPQFTLAELTVIQLVELTKATGQHFGIKNSFFDIEVWKHGNKFTLIEVNCRVATVHSASYKNMWGMSVYEAAVFLACGQIDKLSTHSPPLTHQAGQPISGYFLVPTRSEGKAQDLIDYRYARYGCLEDGIFNNVGPGLTVNFEEDSVVEQISTSGVNLCSFQLCDTNSSKLIEHAMAIMKKTLLHPEDLELVDFKLQ